jgi:hypothetical protein
MSITDHSSSFSDQVILKHRIKGNKYQVNGIVLKGIDTIISFILILLPHPMVGARKDVSNDWEEDP